MYRILYLVQKSNEWAKRFRTVDEFLAHYVTTDKGRSSPREARRKIAAANMYLELALAGKPPPRQVTHLLRLVREKAREEKLALMAATKEEFISSVSAAAGGSPTDGSSGNSPPPPAPAAEARGALDVNKVLAELENQTVGWPTQRRTAFAKSVCAQFQERLRRQT